MTPLLALLAALALAASAAALLFHRMAQRQGRLQARLVGLRAVSAAAEPPAMSGALRAVAAMGAVVARSGLLSSSTLAQLEQTLVSAGLRGRNGLGLFVGSKLLLLLLLPVFVWFAASRFELAPVSRLTLVATSACVGLLLPDYIVRSRRAASMRRIEAGLPDALDLMVICSEAGLGLEPALARVAAEIGPSHPDVATELKLTVSDLRVTSDRRDALLNMGARTGLDSLRRLGTTLVQTLQYGTPLSQALRTLSAEMRGEMLTRFEERAARLPVLLTMPMIIFILPTVFVVVGGPAMLTVWAAVHN